MTPADFLSMFRQKPMKAWKSFIYRYTQEAWKQEAVKVVYVGADKFFQQPDGKVVAAPGAAPIVNKAADAEPEEDKPVDRRTLIANAIYRRLRKEGVGKIGFDRRVATKPPPGRKTGKTIIQGRDYDHIHRRWIGNDRTMTDDDARRLADNYDNWEYFGKNYRTRQALVRLTNPDTLTPEEIEAARPIPLKLATHEAPKFEDETLAAAQAEIDVAVKALKRMIHVDLRPMDGGGGGVDFVVKIPGAGGRALDADRSEEFLKRFRLWDGVLKPIFDKTADAVGSLSLEVQFVNKIEK